MITAIIDSLPHWFHAAKAQPRLREARDTGLDDIAQRASVGLSIERGLRELWNSALWEDHRLSRRDGVLTFGAVDPRAAFYWHACHMRTQNLLIGRLALGHGKRIAPPADSCPLIITGLRGNAARRRFVVGQAPRGNRADYVLEGEVLEKTYVAAFLDEPIVVAGQPVTLRQLRDAFHVLGSVSVQLREGGAADRIGTYTTARRHAAGVRRAELERVLVDTLGQTPAVAGAIVDQLSIDPTDTKRLFADGLWTRPLVILDEDERLLLTPSIRIGSALRFCERVLQEADKENRIDLDKQGRRFESDLRERTIASLRNNPLGLDAECLPHALKTTARVGDIDLVLRLGHTIVVGEAKCFIAPAEPADRFDYLGKLRKAADQATRKADWMRDNLKTVRDALGLTAADADLRVEPIVILNQFYGSGLKMRGATITDVNLWTLYLSNPEYESGAAMKGERRVIQRTEFYGSASEAEKHLIKTLLAPPPLAAILSAEDRVEIPFPVSTENLMLVRPRLRAGGLTEGWGAGADLIKVLLDHAGRQTSAVAQSDL